MDKSNKDKGLLVRCRDYSLDGYRILLMYGICLLHAVQCCDGAIALRCSRLLYWCVPGFVFISGWFGLKFSISKLLKLYGNAFYVVAILWIVKAYIIGDGWTLVSAIKVFRDYWFLNAYAVLMLLAPALNKITEKNEQGKLDSRILAPMLCITFVWAFLNSIEGVWSFVPKSKGVEPFSAFMMMGVYVAARIMRSMFPVDRISGSFLFLIAVFSLPFVLLGLHSYASPFSLALAIVVFAVFKKSVVLGKTGQVLRWMVPSLFSVYLFHAPPEICIPMMKCLIARFSNCGMPVGVSAIMVALLVFVLGILLDMPRRLLGGGISAILRLAHNKFSGDRI